MSNRTANAIRPQYDGELPPPFAISDEIPDGWVLDTRLLYAQPKRACRNCGLPISEAPKRRVRYLGYADVGGSSTGWIHDPGSPILGWQGVRCPGRLTGALPIENLEQP